MATSASTTAAAFVLQATPWAPLVVRRGSAADVSVEIPLDDGDDHETGADGNTIAEKKLNGGNNATRDRARCVVWQFRIDEYDVAFQIAENGRPLQDLVRYAATTTGEEPAMTNAAHEAAVTAEGVITAATRGHVFTFRWDNSYSIVRHKRVFYRFVVTSTRALRAAQTAAEETQQRHMHHPSKAEPTSVKPHLAKRLALERRLTVDEISLEQTWAIHQLKRCVTDMVATFMTDPDKPLHEGSIREFLLSLEALLRNGIKEKYLTAWPEEPYFEFLLQIETVLRDDKQLVADVKALPTASKLQYLGWTRARALLLLALNRNMLHYAFENLIKRRTVIEAYYDSHGLLFMYSSAHQIVAYLSALNGVKFLLAPYPDETFLTEVVLPPNLKQCAPNDGFEEDIVALEVDATGYIIRSGDPGDPDEMKRIEQCSIARSLLANRELHEITIARGVEVSVPIPFPPSGGRGLCVVLQLRVVPGDIAIALADASNDEAQGVDYVVEPLVVAASDGWVDLQLVTESVVDGSLLLLLDNTKAMMRTRQVSYRVRSVSLTERDATWEACQGMAQSMTWKMATKAGIERCRVYMDGLHLRQQQDVAEQQQRSRGSSNDNNAAAIEDDTLFGMGASLITKPVSFLVGGFLGLDGDGSPASCAQCLTAFSFFSRQYQCPSCQSLVCIACSRHLVHIHGKGPQVRVCDRCFIKEMDAEKKRRAALTNGSTRDGERAEYAALREDPSMEKYFKMLSFGVPHSGVAQKMLQDEMPSDKIVVFSAGPSGVTDSNGSKPNRRDGRGRADSESHRGNSFRKVHWKSLATERAAISIWNRETSLRKTAPIRLSPQDFQEVMRLFGRKATGSTDNLSESEKSRGGKKKRAFSALDSQRSNNIAIGLSQFKGVGGADAILQSLKMCDFDFLSSDRLCSIYEIAPTSVEIKRYTNFRGSRSRLEPAEKFLVDMCAIPRVTEKITAMLFVAQFDSQHRELRHRIRLITQACYQILQSERLARCFELVLAIGNLLNSGTDIENSGGIMLESLLKLSETKSIDHTMTLLQFIVRLIHDRGESDVLLFVQEMSAISDAKRFSNVICLSQAKLLQSGVVHAQKEIKEEMLEDVKRFEKAEELRRRRHEEVSQERGQREPQRSTAPAQSNGIVPADPRAALMEMLSKRSQNGTAEAAPTRPSQTSAVAPKITNTTEVLLAASQKRQTPSEGMSSESPDFAVSASNLATPKPALVAAIRARASTNQAVSTDAASSSSGSASVEAASSSVSQVPEGLPRRANLLSAIRARGARVGENDRRGAQSTPPTLDTFKPRVYSVDENRFVSVMRGRVMAIKAVMEQLELDVETMLSAWESTARYLGEDTLSSSSEYVLQLLNRFILDVKIAKSFLSRQGLSFHSLRLTAQVGSTVATKYGPGVVTAIRGDTKLEIRFPWSRESYLSPSSILSVGAVVRCRTFGNGILRSTNYARGFCQVRFGFGFGVVRVEDLKPDTSATGQGFKQAILSGGFLVGDPVITPFGRGSVRSVHKAETSRATDFVVVNMLTDSDNDIQQDAPVAFVQCGHAKTNY